MRTLYAESSAVLRWLLGTPEASSIQATLGGAAEVVTDEVLTRTGESFPIEPLRTLDAVHIATAEFHSREIRSATVLSFDVRVRENAEATGLAVQPAKLR